jgi:hypothetical protein
MSNHREVSGAAVGFTIFAATLMMIGGFFGAIVGLAGILENEFWAIVPAVGTAEAGDAYFLQFDATTWGWIHLIVGLLVGFAGISLLSGAVWARTIGVILASISAIVNFAFIPWYPVWAITVIGLNVAVIWALTVHGRDVARSAAE